MARLDISLPDEIDEWVRMRIAEGDYQDERAYFLDLVEHDRKTRDYLQWLQAEIDKGLASGISERTLEEILDDFTQRRNAA